jgi:hypothetical protein
MKRLSLLLLLNCLIFCGCAHHYVMKLTNGSQITTPSKPKLKGSSYHFKDASGRENVIPQSRVMMIEPASMAAEENQFAPVSPKKKKWYWPF